MSHHHQQRDVTVDVPTHTSYDRFLEFERLVRMYPSSSHQRLNPTPLGLCAFALTIFVFSMYNAGIAVPVSESPGVVMGLALFYGGLIQLLAGLLEFRVGNNFGALAFCSYGGFWLSLASLFAGLFNFTNGMDPTALNNALGVFFLAWFIFTAAMLVSSLKTNLVLVFFFFFLTFTFLLLAACYFRQRHFDLQRAAGAFGIITAIIAWYGAFASLLKRGENSYFSLPVHNLTPEPSSKTVDTHFTNILA